MERENKKQNKIKQNKKHNFTRNKTKTKQFNKINKQKTNMKIRKKKKEIAQMCKLTSTKPNFLTPWKSTSVSKLILNM